MTDVNTVLLAVIALAQATNPYATIMIGPLPADNGISMTVSSGFDESSFMSRNAVVTLDVVCNGKHTDQQAVSEALNAIHEALTRALSYPTSTTWQILNIKTSALPSYIEKQDNGQFLYGSALTVEYYDK